MVNDGTHPQSQLHPSPALFDPQKLLVAEREVLGREGVVVGADPPPAVVALSLRDRAAIYARLVSGELPQELAQASPRWLLLE